MNYKMMGRFISQILFLEAFFMIPALLIGLGCQEFFAARAFGITIALILAVALVLYRLCKGAPSAFYAKDGLVCVGVSWIVLSLLGCLPFYLSREIPKYVDAFFEIVSGFTTTGASIVPAVEDLSHGILYWRSFSHWVGGMVCLCSCWPSPARRARALPCICSGLNPPAPMWANWFPRCAKPQVFSIFCISF